MIKFNYIPEVIKNGNKFEARVKIKKLDDKYFTSFIYGGLHFTESKAKKDAELLAKLLA
jgi:hypothetical protein